MDNLQTEIERGLVETNICFYIRRQLNAEAERVGRKDASEFIDATVIAVTDRAMQIVDECLEQARALLGPRSPMQLVEALPKPSGLLPVEEVEEGQ